MPTTSRCYFRFPFFYSWSFLVCALLLTMAAVALRPGMAALELHYRKQPIALRLALQEFDVSRLSSFLPVNKNEPGPTIIVDGMRDVGTTEAALLHLKEKDQSNNDDHSFLLVTYYSDPEDKVPHTPEVCYRQGGATVLELSSLTFDTPELAPDHPRIQIRLVELTVEPWRIIIAYVFIANGKFCHTREQVRWVNGLPGDRYVYFSKIEASTFYAASEDKDMRKERTIKLLREALSPLLERHFPLTETLR